MCACIVSVCVYMCVYMCVVYVCACMCMCIVSVYVCACVCCVSVCVCVCVCVTFYAMTTEDQFIKPPLSQDPQLIDIGRTRIQSKSA